MAYKGVNKIYGYGGEFDPYAYISNMYDNNVFINSFNIVFHKINEKEFLNFIENELKLFPIIINNNYIVRDSNVNLKKTIIAEEDDIINRLVPDNDDTIIYGNNQLDFFVRISVSTDNPIQKVEVIINYINKSKSLYEKIFELVKTFKNPPKDEKVYFYRVAMNKRKDFVLNKYDIEKIDVKPEYYNNEIDIKNLQTIIDSDKSGLLLFSGLSGSGKTSLIKYLSLKSKKNFIYTTIHEVELFSDSSATTFLSQNLKNSVIVVEDCEILLRNRKNEPNPNISTLLNLGDGLIGQLLNLKVILTYNNDQNIDDALLRKGRCLFYHDFNKVSAENANKISKELGYNIHYDAPQVLCDLFNVEDNGIIKRNKKSKVGFGS